MAKKKTTRKKKPAAKTSGSRRARPAVKKNKAKKATSVRRKKVSRSSKQSRPKTIVRTSRSSADIESLHVATMGRRGLGAGSAGQSGDTQGLSRSGADFESVEELVEEGQDFEAGIVAGVEEADDDQGEVRTKQVLEDDVPLEYLDKD